MAAYLRILNIMAAGVCSIEALFFFLRELQNNGALQDQFRGPHTFDDLLYFFAIQHQVMAVFCTCHQCTCIIIGASIVA